MSVTCNCGHKAATKFCPACGKQINGDSPISQLITYLERNVNRLEKDVEVATSDKRKERMETRLEQWRTWLEGAKVAFDILLGREKNE